MFYIKKPEILSPAGNFEKLKAAVRYGADAVYAAGEKFGMRSACGNFSRDELASAVRYAGDNGVKLYVTVNVMPRDSEYGELRDYLSFLGEIGVDAVIVSDIGVMELVKKAAPNVALHVSTQASTVSAAACAAWASLGAKRVVLARELTLEEIKRIRENVPDELELEAFVHGSMCIAYSGRCLLSQYFTGRDANRGACAQPCRWIYREDGESQIEVREEKRPDIPIPIVQSGGDTFVMSSRDLCMIEHLPKLIEAGVNSFKIEGRVKSAYYAAVVTNTYRMALEDCFASFEKYGSFENCSCPPEYMRELCSVSHREYDTGFFFAPPHERANTVSAAGYIREKSYLATALSDSGPDMTALFTQRNKLVKGDGAELLTVGRTGLPFTASELWDENGVPIDSTPHPGQVFRLRVPYDVKEGDILRGGD